MLCGNLTGARHCPPNFTCLCIGNNPNHGYTNFDNFMWSMVRTQHVLQSFAMSGSRNEFFQLFPGEIILNRFWQKAFRNSHLFNSHCSFLPLRNLVNNFSINNVRLLGKCVQHGECLWFNSKWSLLTMNRVLYFCTNFGHLKSIFEPTSVTFSSLLKQGETRQIVISNYH